MVDHSDLDALRLDLFLYRTRLLKTRGTAARLISTGKVRLTRGGTTDRVKKLHTPVRPGDGLSFMRGQTLLDIVINDIPVRRGPAVEARACYTLNCESENGAPTAPNA